jgi:Uma2 family endonuclease
MATKPALRHWTYDEYARLPDDGSRYEIIDGELYMSPSPRWNHQRAVVRIAHLFETYTEEHGIGEICAGPIDLLLTDTDYLIPELVFVLHEHEGIITERGIEGAPDLVIEIISPSSGMRDRGLKRERYARFGVPLYWIVDLERQSVEVHRLADDPNGEPEIVTADLVWQPVPGGPSLTLSVPHIVGAAERPI